VTSASVPAILALADGTVFRGRAIGATSAAEGSIGEVVFNTAMTGYQEILTDPSYAGQIVTLTYPHVGNTGVNPEDVESRRIFAAGLVIRDLPRLASNWRSTQDLSSYLRDAGVLGICDIDTRKLTRMLREKGAQNGCVIAAGGSGRTDAAAEAVARARAAPSMSGLDLAKVVSCDAPYDWNGGSWALGSGYRTRQGDRFHVVAYDYGIKHSILRLRRELGEWRAFRRSRIAVNGAETAPVRLERRRESAAQRAVDVMRRAGLASAWPVLVTWDQACNHRLDGGRFGGSERFQRLARKRPCLGGK